jgi:hypothetical protein
MSKKLWSDHTDMRRLTQNFREFLTEKADPGAVDPARFPTELSSVDAEKAAALVKAGDPELDTSRDDDVIPVDQDGSWSASQLKPSQTSMNLGKAAWFALGMLNGTMYGSGGPGGETGAFISSDNYLMDGHHRWIATAMADPSAEIKGFAVDFPGKQLVGILNTVTKGLLGIAKGKPGSGGFEQFHDYEAIVKTLGALAADTQDDGKGGKFSGVAGAKEPGMALQVMQKITGQEGAEAVKAMAQQFLKNLKSVKGAKASAVMPGAPQRSDMPVIDDKLATKGKPAVSNTIAHLEKGTIDVNKPYADARGERSPKKEHYRKRGKPLSRLGQRRKKRK